MMHGNSNITLFFRFTLIWHIQTDWSSDLKLRYLCFILLCSKYTYYIYMYVKVKRLSLWLGDAFNVF